MSDDARLKIVMIGSGNVATSLAPAMDAVAGWHVAAVYSPTLSNARTLASRLSDTTATDNPDTLPADADLYVISVSDDAVREVARHFQGFAPDALWVHTSGSVPASALDAVSPRHGVLYPLQTFSRTRPLPLRRVPLFVEGCNEATTVEIERIASALSENVSRADSEIRRVMHVAAVFACNFTNHLWAIADDILRPHGIPFASLEPLLEETLAKAAAISPGDGQTGPARRNDTGVMQAHMDMLAPEQARLYRILSESIINRYSNEQNSL